MTWPMWLKKVRWRSPGYRGNRLETRPYWQDWFFFMKAETSKFKRNQEKISIRSMNSLILFGPIQTENEPVRTGPFFLRLKNNTLSEPSEPAFICSSISSSFWRKSASNCSLATSRWPFIDGVILETIEFISFSFIDKCLTGHLLKPCMILCLKSHRLCFNSDSRMPRSLSELMSLSMSSCLQ